MSAQVIKLPKEPEVRALYKMLLLKKKHGPQQIRKHMSEKEYNLAENEFIARSGDPNRFDKKTGGQMIWP